MLNPSHKSRYMQEFSRFSRIQISPLENKKRSKNKNLKKRVFYLNNKNVKIVFLHLCSIGPAAHHHLACHTRYTTPKLYTSSNTRRPLVIRTPRSSYMH